MGNSREKLIEIKDLKKHFTIDRKSILKAIDGITFDIYKGETFGLVGESGCGKTTVGRTLIRLYNSTEGQIKYKNKDISTIKSPDEIKNYNQKMQMIFQDPYASLNPRMTVKEIISEGINNHNLFKTKEEQSERVFELLKLVGLNRSHADRYPHEFSGGQRQRIGIARALAVNPEFIVADEPISALDVSVQAQVINLLEKLQRELNLTYLFISHDLSVVKYISDRVGVMYLGSMVELASSQKIYESPLHPYTQAMLNAVPIPDPIHERTRERVIIKGDIPSPINPPSGCRFRTRCPYAMDICSKVIPKWQEYKKEHWVACHLYGEEVN